MKQDYINSQAGHPKGVYGHYLLHKMKYAHKDIILWGISHLDIEDEDVILDVGCGAGHTIKHLLALNNKIKVYGLDISATSVSDARKTNRKAIKENRCDIYLENIAEFKYPLPKFSKITAFCTLKFWDDIPHAFENIYALLKDQGIFMICDHGSYDINLVINTLKKVGFKDIEKDLGTLKNLTIIARK